MMLMIIINIMMKMMIVQELLKKYGFGRWTKPEEVWKGRNISRLSVINIMVIVNIVVMIIVNIVVMMVHVNNFELVFRRFRSPQ